MATIYSSLSMIELETAYKEALDNNSDESTLQEYVEEFQLRNIDYPYYGQCVLHEPVELTEEQRLKRQVEELQFQLNALTGNL
jgi:hypothetical protein